MNCVRCYDNATLDDLDSIRSFVVETSRHAGFGDDGVMALQLAVDEAVTNIIVHGYQGRSGSIELQVERVEAGTGSALTLRIRDRADRFDFPQSVPKPDVAMSVNTPGGLGMYLISRGVDELESFPRDGGGNELVLKKNIPGYSAS